MSRTILKKTYIISTEYENLQLFWCGWGWSNVSRQAIQCGSVFEAEHIVHSPTFYTPFKSEGVVFTLMTPGEGLTEIANAA